MNKKTIREIMGESPKNYCIKGRTFDIKEDLKSWAWFWDNENKFWRINDVYNDDISLKAFTDVDGVWIEEIK